MKISKECKCQIIEGIERYPDNMSAAARYIKMPFASFVRRSKFLGVYAPNQGQSNARLDKQSSLSWDDCSKLEKRRRIHKEQNGKCLICGINKWNNKKLILELDHIDGNHDNNTYDNLRILCPNCHSLTPTFRKGKRKNITDEMIKESLIKCDNNIRKTLRNLGLTSNGGTHYARVKKLMKDI